MSRNVTNKVVLITGTREGIGFHTALQLATRNWTVLMSDNQDLQKAKENIITRTSNSNIYTYHLNLSNFQSIRQLAKDIKQTQSYLNVLVNNAGIFYAEEQTTSDGLNPVMQINHLGPFLLTFLLTDLLKQSQSGRILFLTSLGAFLHSLDQNHLPIMQKKNYPSDILETTLTYYNSKLCNMIISREFARRLHQHGITSNCLHPGMTSSAFLLRSRKLGFLNHLTQKLIRLVLQNPEESSRMVAFLAASESVSQITGQYFVNYQENQLPKIVDDSYYCGRVWAQAENLVNLTKEEKLALS